MDLTSFYIENLGCAKNLVDAEIMVRSLTDRGLEKADSPDEADVLIINTCGFIEPAKKESIETTLEYRRLYPDKKIVMAGCLTQRYPEPIGNLLSDIDGIVGNRTPERIGELIGPLLDGDRPGKSLPTERFIKRTVFLSPPGSAYVKIAEGCNNDCSYCAIPLIRGPLRSRSEQSILEEIRYLVDRGIVEINLIAQDLGSYGMDRSYGKDGPSDRHRMSDVSENGGNSGPARLLESISRVPGTFWVRLLYIHPDHFPYDILPLCEQDKRILPYFDIPFQHASKRVLTAMNRRGSGEEYLRLIGTIRDKLPQAVIRSTFLVGFPGERRSDFNTLLRFQEAARLDWAGVFTFSPEEGTAAYSRFPFSRRVPLIKSLFAPLYEKRKRLLEDRQQKIMEERVDRFVGGEYEVLVEERIEGEDLVLGRAYFQAPEVDSLIVLHDDGELSPGDFLRCKVVKRNGIDLEAYPT